MKVLWPTTMTSKRFFILCMAVFLNMAAAFMCPAYATTSDETTSLPAPRTQTTLTADLAAQRNPNGAMLMTAGYRRWIQVMTEDGMPAQYVQTGFGLGVSPAYAKGSFHGEWQPAIFANLRLEYNHFRFFGVNTGLLSFPDAHAKFGRHELKNRKGSEEKATGHRIFFQPTLYAMLGHVIIMNQTDLTYERFNGDGPYFLELEYNTLVKDGDYVIANRTRFLVPSWKGSGAEVLYVGPYYEITHAGDADITRQRVGGQLLWVPANTFWGMNKPRIYSQAGVNIQDRNRRGEVYMALGFGADFNL